MRIRKPVQWAQGRKQTAYLSERIGYLWKIWRVKPTNPAKLSPGTSEAAEWAMDKGQQLAETYWPYVVWGPLRD